MKQKSVVNLGILRFALLIGFFVCLFVLVFRFKGQNEEISSFEAGLKKSGNSNCLLLAVSPYFEEKKVFKTKHPLFFTKNELSRWIISLKKNFKSQKFLLYLPLYRTKDNQWLISSKGFFSSPSGILKISHMDLQDIQKISNFSDKNPPMILKGFLQSFPKERLFLDVFETNAIKGVKYLSSLVQTPVFITSDNERFLNLMSEFDNFKLFYSFKYLVRFQFLRMFQKELALPGSGLVIPDLFSPSVAMIKKIKRQDKMLFLKGQGSLRSFKLPVDGIITSFPFQQTGEDFLKFETFCSVFNTLKKNLLSRRSQDTKLRKSAVLFPLI